MIARPKNRSCVVVVDSKPNDYANFLADKAFGETEKPKVSCQNLTSGEGYLLVTDPWVGEPWQNSFAGFVADKIGSAIWGWSSGFSSRFVIFRSSAWTTPVLSTTAP